MGISPMGVKNSGALDEQTHVTMGIKPEALAAGAKNGDVIDGQYVEHFSVEIQCGAFSGTPDTGAITVKVQHGDESDGSDMADVSATTVRGNSLVTKTIATPCENKKARFLVCCDDLKRYKRVVATPAFAGGTTPKVVTAVALVCIPRGEAPPASTLTDVS